MANSVEMDNLVNKLAQGVTKLVTLTVTTVVCPLTIIEIDANGAPVAAGAAGVDWLIAPPPGGPAQAWRTEINLLDGKIRNTLTDQFASGPLTSLADFHKGQVEQAKTIVHDNIQALIDLAKAIKSFV
jgi:ligand-binding SRPBCC domain-containing protein